MTTFWILWWESSLFPSSSFHSICTNEFWLRVKSQQDGRRKKKLYNSLVGQYGTSRGYFFIQRWEKVLTSHRHSPFLWLWTVISFFFLCGWDCILTQDIISTCRKGKQKWSCESQVVTTCHRNEPRVMHATMPPLMTDFWACVCVQWPAAFRHTFTLIIRP